MRVHSSWLRQAELHMFRKSKCPVADAKEVAHTFYGGRGGRCLLSRIRPEHPLRKAQVLEQLVDLGSTDAKAAARNWCRRQR